MHIHFSHLPFALSLLPFFAIGIGIPPTVQDWNSGRSMHGDIFSIAVGSVVVVAWYFAILNSVKSKRLQGKQKLLGRALDSWIWSPPIALIVGFACGLSLLLTGSL